MERERPAAGLVSNELESVREGVPFVDEDGVEAVHARPAGDRRLDRVAAAESGGRFDAALEKAADDALVDERVADPQLAARGELRHARRGAGAARAAVDRPLAVEDRVARIGTGIARLSGPHHVAD